MESLKKEIGRNLFIARKILRLNHIDLVKLTGVTRPIISSIENGTSNPTMDSILKLSAALNISDEMLTMTKIKFNTLYGLLKHTFSNYIIQEGPIYIPDSKWNYLNKYYDNDIKKYSGQIAKVCGEILQINYPKVEASDLQNSTLGAVLGVIFQKDGFKDGLLFGAWLGDKLK